MKAIMISIKPKWVAKILNGEKTIEIRKTMPKCDLPIDVYICCTQGKLGFVWDNKGKGIVNASLFPYSKGSPEHSRLINGKVVAKFTLNKVEEITKYQSLNPLYTIPACLSENEWCEYLGERKGYAWHIDNLEIFGKSRELSEFKIDNGRIGLRGTPQGNILFHIFEPLNHAPKSWCYVEI